MSTWSGWQSQLLDAANVPDNQPSRNFLSTWGKHASSRCANNPVLISRHATGSSNCKTLPGGLVAQSYTSHASAATAFGRQLNSGNYQHLLNAFKGEVWWEPGLAPGIYNDLLAWGATAFATWYANFFGDNFGGGGGGQTPRAPQAMAGWHDLQRSFGTRLPSALKASSKHVTAALRSLNAARRV